MLIVYAGLQCSIGSYIKGTKCRLCPIGYYTDEPNQSKCQKCPNGKTTADKGSSSIDQCQGMSLMLGLKQILILEFE